MEQRTATSGRFVELRGAWPAAALLMASLGLAGCSAVPDWANPVGWYREVTGLAKDDPTPAARNTQNLSRGGEQPYPNLASVPPPPTNALSSADREKLRNSLAADRANAKYVENTDQYVPVPPKEVASPPLSPPAPPEAAQGAAPAPAPVQATPVPTPPPAASASPPRGGATPPQESSLTSPSVRSVPQGEVPRAAPPPPAGVPTRAQTQRQPPATAPTQTATLPPPSLPPPPPGAALPSGFGVTLGTIAFPGTSAKLSPEILDQVRAVAGLREQNGGGILRVTGYSEPQGDEETMAPQLASFNLALDRAKAVALALTKNGVPANAVEIGASPPPSPDAGGLVEISLEQ